MKSCVELLRSCGLNNLVVFRNPCVVIRLQPIPTTKNIELATLGAFVRESGIFKEMFVCLPYVNQEGIEIGTLNPHGINERFSFNQFILLSFTLPGTNQ